MLVIVYLRVLALQVVAGVHGQAASAAAEAVALGAEFTRVANFAVEFTFML